MAGVSALHICVFQCWIAVLEAAVLFVIIVTDGKEQGARGKTVMYFVCRQYHNNNNNNQERQTIATSSCPLNSKKSHKHVNIMNIFEST